MTVPEGRYVDVGAGRLVHVHEAGRGSAVLFLHGGGPGASGMAAFRANYPAFAGRGFRAIVPDLPGFGRSSMPDDVDYTLDLMLGALAGVLAELSVGRCAVVGSSYGGALAIVLALRRPELVTRLVLAAPAGLTDRRTQLLTPAVRAMAMAALGAGPVTAGGLRAALAHQVFDQGLLTDELIGERLAVALRQPRRVLRSLEVPELAPRLGELACPVFGVWGVEDRFAPVSGALTLAGCHRARVLLVGGCGHWPPVEHAGLFNRLAIDFLDES